MPKVRIEIEKKRHAKHVFTLQALKRINNRVYKIPGLVELFDKIKAKVSELNSLEFKEDTD
uniref:Uncharacterized protein n=1 Tax=viral metagenome TaxID=1070528 RepID=A0A6H2A5B9_9ZZZZ